MNKHTNRHSAYIIWGTIIGSAFLLLTACEHEPIFASIENEVKLADPTILNYIPSLIVCDEDDDPSTTANIYVSNGNVYKRTAGTGNWESITIPTGTRCSALATDALNGTGSLYGFFVDETKWTEFDSIKKWNGSSWTKLDTDAVSTRLQGIRQGIIMFTLPTGPDQPLSIQQQSVLI